VNRRGQIAFFPYWKYARPATFHALDMRHSIWRSMFKVKRKTTTLCLPRAPMKVLVYGDSFCARLCGPLFVVESLPGVTVEAMVALDAQGIGVGLSVSEDRYDAVVLAAGHNDSGRPVPDIVGDLMSLHESALLSCGRTWAVSLPSRPLNSAYHSAVQAAAAAGSNIGWIQRPCSAASGDERENYERDGLHLTADGAARFSRHLQAVLTVNS